MAATAADDEWESYIGFDDPIQQERADDKEEEESVRSFGELEEELDPVRSSIVRRDIGEETRKWLAQQGNVDAAEVSELRANAGEAWLDDVERQRALEPPNALEELDSALKREDLSEESRRYLERVRAAGPLLLESKKRVMHVYVCEPDSGRKIEVRVSVWATVRDFRDALWSACNQSTYTSSGDGYELPERAKHWCDGPLVCGTATLHDWDATLSFYQVKDGSVVFPFGKGDWATAAVDPDFVKDGAVQIGQQLLGFRPMFSLRHKNRGPGGISGNP